ncbi:hypothetical protein Pan153_23710 [Gimesia panareensis]|uniref:VOC domain-containing protein n=1 Tax=Gimesia panareensis TaxID=2527978 RepID=A0A518FN28_9PLAN|nr:VOC family protein [Gimesia panareensis]QDV17717.1 hypothetical protein Pan153_23710 [Gimesia panareensis]
MNSSSVKSIPEGMHSITPHLVCTNAAEAIEFYKKAFGAEELMRLPGPDGKLVHACLQIGDSRIMLADVREECGGKGPKELQGSPVLIHLQVEDVDAVFNQAIEAGATQTMPVMEMFWGDRYGQLEDPFGHRWSVATHIRDLSFDEIQKGMLEMFEQNSKS